MKQIILLGSIAYDYLMRFPGHFTDHILPEHLERLSLSFLVDEMRKERGGVAANIGYTMGLLGGNPLLFATVGQDFDGYRAWLDRHGVDTTGVRVIEDKFTASFFVTTDQGNRQIASFYAGAMADAAQLSLEGRTPEDVEFVVISPTAPDAMARAVRECKALGLPYIYDPSQQTVRLSREELLEGLDGALMLIVNDYELNLIEKKTGLESAEIHRMVRNLVVTRGEKGVTILNQHSYHIPPALTDDEVDPTGVGDAFRGGFLWAYSAGAGWEVAGKVGALAATYCLEHVGTQGQHYMHDEFITRYEQVYGDAAPLHAIFTDYQPINH